MRDHARPGVAHTIADDFLDWFAIAGPAETAVRRFRRRAELGVDFVHLIPGSTGMAPDVATCSSSRATCCPRWPIEKAVDRRRPRVPDIAQQGGHHARPPFPSRLLG
jgi:hypothetical protein